MIYYYDSNIRSAFLARIADKKREFIGKTGKEPKTIILASILLGLVVECLIANGFLQDEGPYSIERLHLCKIEHLGMLVRFSDIEPEISVW